MYNYYLDLKRQKEKEEKKKQEEFYKKYKKMHEKRTTRLIHGYENRIKNFLYQMAESPIKIKEEPKYKTLSTRQELLMEEEDKILFRKGFVFSHYIPERDLTEEKMYEEQKQKKLSVVSPPITDLAKNPMGKGTQIIQPSMRFKPRTDLERVYDTLMLFNSSENVKSKDVVKTQLNNMGFNVKKKEQKGNDPEDMCNNDEDNNEDYIDDTKSKKGYKNSSNNLESYEKEMKTDQGFKLIKTRVNNQDAKKLHHDLYNKTYFKAVENYSLFKTTCFLPDKFTAKYRGEIIEKPRNIFHHHHHRKINPMSSSRKKEENFDSSYERERKNTISSYNKPYNNISTPAELINMINQTKKDKEANLIKSLDNIDLFTQSLKNTVVKKTDVDPDKFEKLKEIAFSHDNNHEFNIKKRMKKNKMGTRYGDNSSDYRSLYPKLNSFEDITKKVEDKIKIDGVEYNKNDFETLSKVILTKCNWSKPKYKYQTEE